jgi:alpha-ketoglutarate-dependent taurine dioxygenase
MMPNDTTSAVSQTSHRGIVRTPKPVKISGTDLVEIRLLEGNPLPLVITPREPGSLKCAEWAAQHRPFIDEQLLKVGAILFRGFGDLTLDSFSQVVGGLCDRLMNYTEGATPRTELKDKFYTSTEYPPEYGIALHNEISYVITWPMKLWFGCAQPSPTGGETPIADVRKVYQRLDPSVRELFERRGWMLVRNYGDGLSLPWQKVFRAHERADVEAYCRENQVEFEWYGDERLRTRHLRAVTRIHPQTGETVWFNHVAFWHITSLEPPELREEFQRQMAPADLPYNTYFGDGSPISDDIVEQLRSAYAAETVAFRWESGDVLMLDNLLVAHGRNPFSGPRRILASMGDPHDGSHEHAAFLRGRGL